MHLRLVNITKMKVFTMLGWAAGRATEWWGAGVVICLQRGADLYTAQLMDAVATHCLLLQLNPDWF